jgi:hypothetical protein
MLCRREQFRIELAGRQVVLQRRATTCGRAQLRRPGGPHAREPIQSLRTIWSQSGDRHRAGDAF